jgi:hypothetical protein
MNIDWQKNRNTIHQIIELMTLLLFQQIKRHFHVLPTLPPNHLHTARRHKELEPLASLLRTELQVFVVLGENINL